MTGTLRGSEVNLGTCVTQDQNETLSKLSRFIGQALNVGLVNDAELAVALFYPASPKVRSGENIECRLHFPF